MSHLIYLAIGILLIIGGVFTFRHAQGYLKLNATSKAVQENQWRGFALWFGYIEAGFLTLIGVIMILVSLF